MAGYSKELIIAAAQHRFKLAKIKQPDNWEDVLSAQYDRQGKDKFREYASVTPEAIRVYKQFIKEGKTYES